LVTGARSFVLVGQLPSRKPRNGPAQDGTLGASLGRLDTIWHRVG